MYKMLTTSLALVTFGSLALAQDTPAKPIKIEVGRGNISFTPNNVQANVGDTISFHFNPTNHSVTQSSFLEPCQKLQGIEGLNSGYRPTTVVTTNLIFTITVLDTGPLWFYCMQKNHCHMGMVFAVNPTADQTFDAFQARALALGSSSASPAPSDYFGSPTGTVTSTITGTDTDSDSDAGSGTATGENGASTTSNAISAYVNVGLTAVLAVVVVFILAL